MGIKEFFQLTKGKVWITIILSLIPVLTYFYTFTIPIGRAYTSFESFMIRIMMYSSWPGPSIYNVLNRIHPIFALLVAAVIVVLIRYLIACIILLIYNQFKK